MVDVTFNLRGDLASLASPPRAPDRVRHLREPASVKDALEALGIPHTEIDLLLIDQRPVDFGYLLAGGESVHVFPTPDIQQDPAWPQARLQPRPLERDRFVCDQHLGRLARLLRILGCDTAYDPENLEADVARRAVCEDRAVLTCSRALLKRREIACGRLIRARRVDEQVVEVTRRFGLPDRGRWWTRCSVCNGRLASVDMDAVRDRIPARTRAWRREYYICSGCDRLYWEGTHVLRLRKRILKLFGYA
jgi:uncharacterized protein with PIN domain